MPSALVTLITLIIGLFLGLGLGIWISRMKNTSSSSDSLAQELNDVKVLLKASDDRLKAAEAKSENDTKIATQMEEMKASVERMRAQSQEAAEKRIASETQLVGTIDEMRKASTTFFDETKKIAGALASSQTRGKFGEAQLQLLLEQAGLREGHEYDAQRSTTDADSSGIPDITVHMPGGSKLFIDSKFPFDRFIEAHEEEDADAREALFTEHRKDLSKHVETLAKRGYHESQDSPDFVILFVPFESLLTEALRVDPLFLEKAFKLNVTIATPTSMMALLRTIGNVYSRNAVARNAEDISKSAAAFMKDLTRLHERIIKVGSAINSLSKAYAELIPTAESTVKRAAAKILSYGVSGDKDKLALAYPDAPAEVRELKNSEITAEDDFIDAEEVKEDE